MPLAYFKSLKLYHVSLGLPAVRTTDQEALCGLYV